MEARQRMGLYESPLGLFNKKDGKPNVNKITSFLDISRRELAKSFGFTEHQLRPNRMGSLTEERIQKLAQAIEDVARIFSENENSHEKTKYWFNTPNSHFAEQIPKKLILKGRHKPVFLFINASKEGY